MTHFWNVFLLITSIVGFIGLLIFAPFGVLDEVFGTDIVEKLLKKLNIPLNYNNMIIIAIVIVIDDPKAGPFFKQKRVGRHGEEFYMYKFRTMKPNAEQLLEQLKDQIAQEEARGEELENYSKYINTKQFVEQVAREKLGLVYPGEIIFKGE